MIRNAARSEKEPVVHSRGVEIVDGRWGEGVSEETPCSVGGTGSSHVFSNLCPRCFFHVCSIATSVSPGEQASHEKPGTVCMGSWTQCTDEREIATWRKHPHAIFEVRCGVSDLTDIPIDVFRNSDSPTTVRPMEPEQWEREGCLTYW